MGHGNGDCLSCPSHIETCNHFFFACTHALRAWASNVLYYKEFSTDNNIQRTNSLISNLDLGLVRTTRGTTFLFVLYQTCWSLWLIRNDRVFNQKVNRFSPRVNADPALAHLEATSRYALSHKKRRRMR